MTVELKNTYVIRTDDENFTRSLDEFLNKYCEENKVNAAYFKVSDDAGEKVMDLVFKD